MPWTSLYCVVYCVAGVHVPDGCASTVQPLARLHGSTTGGKHTDQDGTSSSTFLFRMGVCGKGRGNNYWYSKCYITFFLPIALVSEYATLESLLQQTEFFYATKVHRVQLPLESA